MGISGKVVLSDMATGRYGGNSPHLCMAVDVRDIYLLLDTKYFFKCSPVFFIYNELNVVNSAVIKMRDAISRKIKGLAQKDLSLSGALSSIPLHLLAMLIYAGHASTCAAYHLI